MSLPSSTPSTVGRKVIVRVPGRTVIVRRSPGTNRPDSRGMKGFQSCYRSVSVRTCQTVAAGAWMSTVCSMVLMISVLSVAGCRVGRVGAVGWVSWVRAEGGDADGPGSAHGDDDLAACVSLLQVAQACGGVGQWEGAVEDRRELPGLDERGDGEQVFAVPLVR